MLLRPSVPPFLGTDTAETVELSLARITASSRDCGVDIASNFLGILTQAARWMRDSARLPRILDQSDCLSSALEEIVNSSKGAAPANLVEEVSDRFGVDADEGAVSSVVVEVFAHASDGAAVAASASVIESDDDELVEPAAKRVRRIRSRNSE